MLEMIEFLVEYLQGTPYVPQINFLLFVCFIICISRLCWLAFGKSGRAVVVRLTLHVYDGFKNRKGYAPEVNQVLKKMEPYANLGNALILTLVGLYGSILYAVMFLIACNEAPLWLLLIMLLIFVICVFYVRINLENASWAWHDIQKRRGKY
ncbi:hypothetical protein KIK84_07680 [Curvibacter sp. CHRR-16]|uniref:hypothetical protein n=1 Tax=Curvibacter sp. CHRR-16 TaxID=2835872 RepID=UPI001BDAC12D|nr:hypothetical protein [Curvibacter sp. CHRR-16]MBT0570201.1 hypothetical protein [Curvibacter sp. CHRR-16]